MDELRPTVHPQLFLTSVQLKVVALVHYCIVYLHMYWKTEQTNCENCKKYYAVGLLSNNDEVAYRKHMHSQIRAHLLYPV